MSNIILPRTFQGAAGRRITIVSAYQVVSDIVVPGTTTAASQQHSLLLQRNDSTLAPRKAFRRDLTAYLQQCKSAGDEIMLMGDFNEVMGDDPEGMALLAQKLELFDMMSSAIQLNRPHVFQRSSMFGLWPRNSGSDPGDFTVRLRTVSFSSPV